MRIGSHALGTGAAAAAVGLAGALVRRPWHDELYTLELARRPVPAILEALRLDSGPPGHYLLARGLEAAGLGGVLWLRLLSVAAVALGVALAAEAAGRRWGRATGWLAGGLLVVHPVVLLAATEARAYGLLFLAAAACTAVLAGGKLNGRRAAALGAALAAACWVHALGLVLALGVVVAAAALPAPERRRAWAASAVALASSLPWLPVMTAQPPEALAWMMRIVRHPGSRLLLVPLGTACPLLDLSPWLDLLPALSGLWWLAPVAGAAALAGALASRERRPLAILWTGPALLVVAASLLLRPVYFPGRGDTAWAAAAVVLLAVVLDRARRPGRLVAVLLLCLGGAGTGRTLWAWHGAPPGPEAAVARALDGLVRPGDVVVTTGWWGLDVRWAMGRRGRGLVWLTFPPAAARHPGWYSDREATPAAAGRLLEELRSRAGHGGRIWLLRSPPLPSDRLLDRVAAALGMVPRASGGPLWQLWGPPPAVSSMR